MKNLIIFGASGFGREVAWLAERINNVSQEWNILGFIDDDESLQGKIINNYTVLGKTEDTVRYPDAYYVCAVGSARIREKIINNLKHINPEIKFATLIDPSAIFSQFVSIGEGSIICAHSIMTVNIEIGKHVIINLDCTIGHGAVIEDYVTLYPSVNISGGTRIGKCSELGTGTQIIQSKMVGEYSIVGASAVVIKDIPDNCTAVGIPAKPIKINK